MYPNARMTLFAFEEAATEPQYLDSLKAFADSNDVHFIQARKLHDTQLESFWREDSPDLLIAVSWRYMIAPSIARRAARGTFVLHDSILPKYRGFSPTPWAIINGERETGATLFRVTEEAVDVDSGPIVGQIRIPILDCDDIATVMEKITIAYLDLLGRHLGLLVEGRAITTEQDVSGATYTCRRLPADNRIDWTRTARQIHDLVRATTRPYSGAFTTFQGKKLTVWKASLLPTKTYVGSIKGRVVERRTGIGVVALAGDGPILIEQVQLDSGQLLSADVIVRSLSDTLV
jgi:methionyl-tRNA formyltransferase